MERDILLIYIYNIHIHACMHACMHACIHTYIHTYIHIHTTTSLSIYIYIHTYMLVGVNPRVVSVGVVDVVEELRRQHQARHEQPGLCYVVL